MDAELDTLKFDIDERPNAWMITFADLLSLMLTFFVLMYSMSVITIGEWEELVRSLQQRLNPDREVVEFNFSEDKMIVKKDKPLATDLDYLFEVIQDKLASGTSEHVVMRRLDDRVVISLASDLLFTPGSADLSSEGEKTLSTVADIVGSLNNKVTVNGHTDPTPIKTKKFPSNWELSLSRAHTVAERIYASGYLKSIDMFGLADSRYDEISENYTKTKRYELARRVDIEVRSIAAE